MMEDKARDMERIKMLEQCRESGELKSPRKEITERVTVASRQFKVMDVDFGTEITDRKELIALAKTKMADKVRADKVRADKVRVDKVRADKIRADKVSVHELMGWVQNVVLIKCIFGSGKPKGGRDFGWEGTWAR
jgi:hypothetical protein